MRRTRVTLRGEALELAGIRFWTRRASEIYGVHCETRSDTVLLLAHDPRRLTEAAKLNVPAVLVRTYPRRSGRSARRRCACEGAFSDTPGTRPAGQHVDLRESRHRDGLRAGENQLPAGSRAGHAPSAATRTSVISARKRRPSTFQPPFEHDADRLRIREMLLLQNARRQASRACRPSRTGTARCSTIGPASRSRVTKWTVTPLTLTP